MTPADKPAVLARLDEIRARAEAATPHRSGLPKPARWLALTHMWSKCEPQFCMFCGVNAAKHAGDTVEHKPDCIAIEVIEAEERAQAIMPDLLAAIAHLRAERERMAGERDAAWASAERAAKKADHLLETIDTFASQRDAARAELATAREQAERREVEVRREALEAVCVALRGMSSTSGQIWQSTEAVIAAVEIALAAPPAAPEEVSR